ncbi:hypothetical protein VTN77DRAFT_1927 [Rasamsonia byssochlamydoides]|uniref:uncharacterized protein n=1 Tax=Rasamsonia byssochlamydoides TaxID=89139 RepID=UPI003743A922
MAHSRDCSSQSYAGQTLQLQKEMGPEIDTVEVLKECENGTYYPHRSTLDKELLTPDFQATSVIFASSKAIESWTLRQQSNPFPADFWPVVSRDLNGHFGCQYHEDGAGRVVGHDSWSCFKIKQVDSKDSQIQITYDWMQIAVFIRMRLEGRRPLVLFVDYPTELRAALQARLPEIDTTNPFAWHATFINDIKRLYDQSIWSLRDLVRGIEKKRHKTWNCRSDFPRLHDIGRHIIHSNETMAVSTNTVESIMHDCTIFNEECPGLGLGGNPNPRSSRQVQQRLFLGLQELHALKARSVSLNERLQNEINLAFNLVSQNNHEVAVELGENSRSDNAMMKTIAIVSLVYLPGTFVSGLFGMNFFNFNPNNASSGVQVWTVSENFWLYWAITGPLTIATMLLWAMWHYHEKFHFRWILRQVLRIRQSRKDRLAEEEKGSIW